MGMVRHLLDHSTSRHFPCRLNSKGMKAGDRLHAKLKASLNVNQRSPARPHAPGPAPHARKHMI